MRVIRLANEAATVEQGRLLAEDLKAGDCVALTGDLGAGKTHLSKGIVAGLGSAADVTSPTFTLVHEYVDGRLPVFHFDFYRLESEDDVFAIGWDEYLDAGGVLIVEWADKFPALMPEYTQWWELAHDEGGRILKMKADAKEV